MRSAVEIARDDFDRWKEVLELLQAAFGYQRNRIDQPSSLYRLDVERLAEKGDEEQLFVAKARRQLVLGARSYNDAESFERLSRTGRVRRQRLAGNQLMARRLAEMAGWYSRSVFFVTDLAAACRFYVEDLEFTEAWRYEEDGKPIVTQVDRADCEIILAVDPHRAGKCRVFIALETDEMVELQALIGKGALNTPRGWWGYPVLEIRDPDGNELLFPMAES